MSTQQVQTELIADSAITTAKLANANVTAAKLASGAAVSNIGAGGITSNELASSAVTPAKIAQPLTSATALATTSGTSVDFTSIPSWVKRITVMFGGVSTSASSRVLIQLGASGSVVTTGYASYTSDTGTTSTSGFIIGGATSSDVRYGIMTLVQQDTNKWVASGVTNSSTTSAYSNVGSVTLAAALDRIRITTNGADTFDAGSVNILYE